MGIILRINQLEINSEDYEKIQLSGGGGGGDVDPEQVRDIALSVVQEESPNILTSASIETSSIVSTYVDGILSDNIPDIANEAIRSAISTGLSLDTAEQSYKLVIEDANYQE